LGLQTANKFAVLIVHFVKVRCFLLIPCWSRLLNYLRRGLGHACFCRGCSSVSRPLQAWVVWQCKCNVNLEFVIVNTEFPKRQPKAKRNQGTSLLTGAATNQGGCPKGSPLEAQVLFPKGQSGQSSC